MSSIAFAGWYQRQPGHVLCCAHQVLSMVMGPCSPDRDRCHRDSDEASNNVWNLRWASRTADIEYCVRRGRHNIAWGTHCARGHAYMPENIGMGKSRERGGIASVRKDCRPRYARYSYRREDAV